MAQQDYRSVENRIKDAEGRLNEHLVSAARELRIRERERAEEEAEQQARADSIRREEDRRDRELRLKHAARYDEIYESFGEKCPSAYADEAPQRFRRRLLQNMIDRLPKSEQWSRVRADDVGGNAIRVIEEAVLDAARREAEKLSREFLPKSAFDPRAERVVVDRNGARKHEFFAKRSFIKDLSAGSQRIAITDPRTYLGQQLIQQRWYPRTG
jgi:hypothetical protein